MQEKKGRGSPAGKKSDPQRKHIKVKCLNKNKAKELKSQASQLFLKFTETYPATDLTLNTDRGVRAFIWWLKEEGYSIIHADDLLVVPFSKLAKLKNLK